LDSFDLLASRRSFNSNILVEFALGLTEKQAVLCGIKTCKAQSRGNFIAQDKISAHFEKNSSIIPKILSQNLGHL
jgi:hypothetical protein